MMKIDPVTGNTVNPALQPGNGQYLEFLGEQVREINMRTAELRNLLKCYSTTLEHEGLRQQLETLEQWMEINAESLNIAIRVFEMGPIWLDEVQQKLQLATEELARLTGEGGNPGPEQTKESQELMKIREGVTNVLDSLSKLFAKGPEEPKPPVLSS